MSRLKLPLDGAKSTLRVTLARGVAMALETGFDELAETERPLTQVQRSKMLEMALMAYHEAVLEGEDALDNEALVMGLVSPKS